MICPSNCTAMRKTIILTLLFLDLATAGLAQTVYQKDKWGAKLLFFQDNTIRIKDRWGDAVYYFDFTPTLWQLAAVILM